MKYAWIEKHRDQRGGAGNPDTEMSGEPAVSISVFGHPRLFRRFTRQDQQVFLPDVQGLTVRRWSAPAVFYFPSPERIGSMPFRVEPDIFIWPARRQRDEPVNA